MPLAFLTADRAFDEAADDAPLPYDDQDQWRRPYRPGPWRVGAAAILLLLASFVLVSAVIIAAAGGMSGAAVTGALGLAVVASALRLLRMGVWVNATGLRHVRFFLTRTTPWNRVRAVRTAQRPVKWLALPRTVQGQALELVVREGATEAGRPAHRPQRGLPLPHGGVRPRRRHRGGLGVRVRARRTRLSTREGPRRTVPPGPFACAQPCSGTGRPHVQGDGALHRLTGPGVSRASW